jgi:hypothetical protein
MKYGKTIGGLVLGVGLAAVFLGALFFGTAATAGQLREVVLGDGSVILAEVVSLKDGVYTLKSETMGTLNIDENAIRTIRSPGAGETTALESGKPGAGKEEMAAMRQSMMGNVMSNPGLLGMIFSLRNDPDVQNVLQDPEVMEKVMAGDLEGLRNDPKFRELMENPTIQSLTDELTQ